MSTVTAYQISLVTHFRSQMVVHETLVYDTQKAIRLVHVYIFSGVITSVTPASWKNSLWGEQYYENAITTDDVFSHPDKPIPKSREFAEVQFSILRSHIRVFFSVIGFRFYRITRELKKFKMLSPLGSEHRHL